MKLSRKKAIKLCIELWTWLAKTGKLKSEWPGWEKYDDYVEYLCWFCEYGKRQEKRYKHSPKDKCDYCPLYISVSHCGDGPYSKWFEAQTPRTRKKYAKLFLEQIKSIT